jgi:hypothetical protein
LGGSLSTPSPGIHYAFPDPEHRRNGCRRFAESFVDSYKTELIADRVARAATQARMDADRWIDEGGTLESETTGLSPAAASRR